MNYVYGYESRERGGFSPGRLGRAGLEQHAQVSTEN